ncbi:unnamed protein product [Polarella glacialis]|uniref:PPM-type phosphatase domain-containing protein n=1 Tax=Polarella glacialis TaxID=89957 RepID=A0A813KKJ5_POLGL|nr:unnamed protein product [Polarella glacialis]CAE8705092.1 unnamed protein product [Polarella glacialis]|mmetsp:Transcript_4157/g.6611  ORF Transcript_4157/g.6611 Transcript_4157/m.6611 type:complete len:381 (+) Transcript_4157:117-1259(+)
MGGLLDKPIKDKRIDTGGSERMQWSAADMQGWRQDQEDEHIAIADVGEEFAGIGVYCVFDGHGGKAVSGFCKQNFLELLRRLTVEEGRTKFGKNKSKKRHCAAHLEVSDLSEILVKTFHGMDDQLREPANAKVLARMVGKVPGGAIEDLKARLQDAQKRQQQGLLSAGEQHAMKESYVRLQKFEQAAKGDDFNADNVGCTAICVLVRQSDVLAANAGDSRAIMCRAGQAVELSFDHKPASDIEKNRIEAAGGYLEDSPGGARVNGNLNLSRAIGDLEYKKSANLPPEEQIICSTPDVLVKDLTPDDEFIVLGCDGIWDVMTNQEVCDFVRPRLVEKMGLEQISEELLEHCISPDPQQTQGLGTDNMTAVIVKLNDSKLWQ